MSVTDPVADMLTRIRNASAVSLETVELPHSILKNEIVRILKKEGYVRDYTTEGHGGKRTLRIYLRYTAEGAPVIQGLRRVSKPGTRRYAKVADVPRVLRGMGVAILNTSAGVLTDQEARKRHIGGEVLCYVW